MLYEYYIINKWKIPKLSSSNKMLEEIYKDKLIWNKIKNILNNEKKWFDNYELGKIDKNNWIVVEKIEYLFSAFDRKKYLKIRGWNKIYIPNFIQPKDIINDSKNKLFN